MGSFAIMYNVLKPGPIIHSQALKTMQWFTSTGSYAQVEPIDITLPPIYHINLAQSIQCKPVALLNV